MLAAQASAKLSVRRRSAGQSVHALLTRAISPRGCDRARDSLAECSFLSLFNSNPNVDAQIVGRQNEFGRPCRGTATSEAIRSRSLPKHRESR
jgi:hypothetical protein